MDAYKRDHTSGEDQYFFTDTTDLKRIPSSRLDARSDEEIIASLLQYQPITSEKNIWTFWDTGFWQMRPYVRRNVIGWVRRLGPEWTVRVVDHVDGSPTNINAYLSESEFPSAFNRGNMTGPYAGVHKGDLVRLPLLYHYGGVWMDAGTTLFRHMNDICWKALEDPKTPYEVAGFAPGTETGNDVIMNGFIAAKKGNGFVRRWHDVFLEIWKDRTDCIGLQDHPLLRQVKKVEVPKDMQIKFGIDNSLMNDYVAHVLSFKRVRMLQDPDDGFNGPEYWEKHAYVLPVEETFLAQIICAFDGQRQFDLLSLPRDEVNAELAEDKKAAEHLVQSLLAKASTMKLSHGLKNNKLVHLSKLWDLPENADADIKPGSFGAFLRWGSVHLDQTRSLAPLTVRCAGGVLRAGLLEIVGEDGQ
ncbi:putative capsule polysaccharide biosynthesis protein [Emericellopsis atlantica]|uniref:Capsule polysaccharide biosynthesis protein n=1 Tax=Emericellopsis atlantica TaxID=2614577 RepID=A0A9P7ZUV2_9HYPO|nr:putative capsule polysaccharide biosynthesis protein [Emericellopsis atlantica]KAG9258506.1 putative capsule polysaccharide biosynthesis protein [Emericellopsis atlantica]